MRTINVEKTAAGYRTTNVHGKTIATFETGNDERDHNDAQMNAHHARFSPTLQKRLGFKKKHGSVDGTIWARPFWNVYAEIVKTSDGNWQTLCTVDGEDRYFAPQKTKTAALKALCPLGDEMLTTRNILNPEAGDIAISRSEKGGCTDPGTERYHSM